MNLRDMPFSSVEVLVDALTKDRDAARNEAGDAFVLVQRLEREHAAMLATLTETQAACTQLREANRVLTRGELDPLVEAIARGRAKYPKGACIEALLSEAGEVATAMMRETPDRLRSELLDLAVVATRLALGEWDDRVAMPGRGTL